DHITSVAELNLPQFGPHRSSNNHPKLPSQHLEGIAIPLRSAAGGKELSTEELSSREFNTNQRYVKLRPEADQALVSTGTGTLYLGFRQDPILGASWNNLAEPPRYRVIAPDGLTITPKSAESPKLNVESDSEPREFLVNVSNWKADHPIEVEIQYFACNQKLGWCKPITQSFTIWLEEDETGGKVAGRSHNPSSRRINRNGRGEEQTGANDRLEQGRNRSLMAREDRNQDGKVSKEEFRGSEQRFRRLDQNQDGYIDADEAPTGTINPRRQ
ncbi:MAG: hypothetical protein ACQKBU_01095, partial [Verrucomicrobiales bacterium]